MKRFLLLVLGFGCGGLVAAGLLLGAGKSLQWSDPAAVVTIPALVEGTPLEALELCSYDGNFYEDGSGRWVTNVAALVIRNRGEELVQKGCVKLRQGERELEFSFSMLPAGATLLIPESRGKSFETEKIGGCWGWTRVGNRSQPLQVQEAGRNSLRFHNGGSELVSSAVVWFKDYDREHQRYVGGVSYSVEIRDLPPGHSVVIPVYRYTSGKSAVVG